MTITSSLSTVTPHPIQVDLEKQHMPRVPARSRRPSSGRATTARTDIRLH